MKQACLGVAALVLAMAGPVPVRADVPPLIRIGVLNDMSGPYSDNAGKGSVIAARMAADDFVKAHPGVKVEVIPADHQNRPDVGSTIARQWVSEKMDAIFDIANSPVAFAVNDLVRGTHTALIASSAASSDLTGKFCSPNTVQWTYDTWAVSHTLALALHDEGARSWFVVATDNALGKSLVTDVTSSLDKLGDHVIGTSYMPLNSSDYSSPLLQAAASGANVIAFATAGGDAAALMKQSEEFGMRKPGSLFAAMIATPSDVRSAGLQAAQGVLLVQPYYPSLNAGTQAWAERFAALDHGAVPSGFHAGVYSSAKAYLDAVAQASTTDAAAVIRTMKTMKIHDEVFGDVVVRPDGRAIHSMSLFRGKTPSESKGPDDLLTLVETVSGEQAFRPLDQGGCPLLAQMTP